MLSKRQHHPNLHHWRAGAEALERLCGKRLYVCPLCLRGFREDQAVEELSREHVPPEKLDGRRMFLTCKEKCNSEAGSQLDHHAITEERARQFGANQNYGRLPVNLSFAGLQIAAEVRKDGSTNIISVPSPNNRTDNRWKTIEEMAAAAHMWGVGSEFQIRLRKRHIPRRSEISWLRSAYLLTFAWLGYRYVCRDVLDTVRAQIREPTTPYLGTFCVYNRAADARRIIAIHEPQWLKGIGVSAHGRIVLLPLLDEDHGFYERLAVSVGDGLRIRGRTLGWPERAMYYLDHTKSAELRSFVSFWNHPEPGT